MLLGFALVLVVAVLVSALASRSVLSTAVLFLAGGFLFGVFGIIPFDPQGDVLRLLSELALFSVLYTDGMRAGLRDLARAWHLPTRVLLLGLPLTLGGIAVLAHLVVGLPWAQALLIGAVLSPTDPVFASAIVGREEVSPPLRRLLNVESGLNDGLALPIVIVMLAAVGAESDVPAAFTELGVGVVVGVAVPWAITALAKLRFLAASAQYEPLSGFAIGLTVFALASTLHANLFLAAFAAGVTVATVSPETRHSFHAFGELVTELLKLAALFAFGGLMSPSFLAEIGVRGYVFAVLALVAVRPIALPLALVGSGLQRLEYVAAAWFGPKGFASVVYGLLILQERVSDADRLFHLVAVVTALSMIVHSSTDVVIARWFRAEEHELEEHPPR